MLDAVVETMWKTMLVFLPSRNDASALSSQLSRHFRTIVSGKRGHKFNSCFDLWTD